MSSIKARLFSAASADAGLRALLLDGSTFQWYDTQLPQNANITTKSAVVVQLISNPSSYQLPGRMATSAARFQFTVFGHGNDSQNAEAVSAALYAFFGTLQGNGLGVIGIPGDRDGGLSQTQPLTYLRMIDAYVWNDESF